MEKETRNEIRKMVEAARSLLEQEIQEQLEGVYGLHKDGTLEDLSFLPQIIDDQKAIKAREGFEYFITYVSHLKKINNNKRLSALSI